ncbi:MAG: M24 family metallopeptidase [Verrucomicrobiota bacterium]
MNESSREMLAFYASPERDADLFYWGGFRAPDPFLAFEIEGKRFAALSSLEFGRGQKEGKFDVVLPLEELMKESGAGNDIARQILFLASEHGVSSIRVPDDFPGKIACDLKEEGSFGLEFSSRPVFKDRLRKSVSEQEFIRSVNNVISGAFDEVHRVLAEAAIKDGSLWYEGDLLRSEDVRQMIAVYCLKHGCLAEGTIVAGGDQACDPHERGSGALPADSLIIVDIFPRSEQTGYFGDMTRTFLKGKASPQQRKLVDAVRVAQEMALATVSSGVDGLEIHRSVNDSFEKAGFETGKNEKGYFGFFHGTGHGLGLEIHEEPRVSRQPFSLESGMVTTIEPGLYYPGLGGCRIEDVVVVQENGMEMLSAHPREWEIA